MFKHLSLSEKIELLLGTRTSGGALPLPEAFGAALSYLHDRGDTPDDVLKKVIRDRRQVEFREPRILEVCDDWDSFCSAILDSLEFGEFIIRREGSWSLSEKAIPGKELTILRIRRENGEDRRARVTFFGEQHRTDRNEVEKFKNEIDILISRKSLDYLSPVANETINQYLLSLSGLLREALQGPPRSGHEVAPLPELPSGSRGRRGRPGQAKWYRQYIPTVGWHTMNQALVVWNETHPDLRIDNVSYFSARNEANRLVSKGVMEREEATGRDFFRYRYVAG